MNARSRRTRSPLLLLLLGLPALAVLIGLGAWQYQRLQWKEALLATIAERIVAPPVPLSALVGMADQGQDFEYLPVAVSGRLLNDREQYFLATYKGQSGWYVYVPALTESGMVFVNRGFVPYDRRDPASRMEGQIETLDNAVGLARAPLFEKPSRLVPDNDPAKNTFYWKDLVQMTAAAELDPDTVLPFFIDLKAGGVPGGLPVGGVTQIDLPNNHFQYMLTWWGLALGLAGVMLAWWLRVARA